MNPPPPQKKILLFWWWKGVLSDRSLQNLSPSVWLTIQRNQSTSVRRRKPKRTWGEQVWRSWSCGDTLELWGGASAHYVKVPPRNYYSMLLIVTVLITPKECNTCLCVTRPAAFIHFITKTRENELLSWEVHFCFTPAPCGWPWYNMPTVPKLRSFRLGFCKNTEWDRQTRIRHEKLWSQQFTLMHMINIPRHNAYAEAYAVSKNTFLF